MHRCGGTLTSSPSGNTRATDSPGPVLCSSACWGPTGMSHPNPCTCDAGPVWQRGFEDVIGGGPGDRRRGQGPRGPGGEAGAGLSQSPGWKRRCGAMGVAVRSWTRRGSGRSRSLGKELALPLLDISQQDSGQA